MTEQESIDLLRFAYPKEFTKPITEKVISMAVEALEKQIPKKPTQVDKWGEFFQCPRCNGFVTDYFGCRMKYCSRCGQALKWESEE